MQSRYNSAVRATGPHRRFQPVSAAFRRVGDEAEMNLLFLEWCTIYELV